MTAPAPLTRVVRKAQPDIETNETLVVRELIEDVPPFEHGDQVSDRDATPADIIAFLPLLPADQKAAAREALGVSRGPVLDEIAKLLVGWGIHPDEAKAGAYDPAILPKCLGSLLHASKSWSVQRDELRASESRLRRERQDAEESRRTAELQAEKLKRDLAAMTAERDALQVAGPVKPEDVTIHRAQCQQPWTVPYGKNKWWVTNNEGRLKHCLAHTQKTIGKIAAVIEALDHANRQWLTDEECDHVGDMAADLVTVALQMGTTVHRSVAHALVRRVTGKNGKFFDLTGGTYGRALICK